MKIVCLLLSLFSFLEGASCLILLDHTGDGENVGRYDRYYLTTKLQSALAERATPILLHASLWNSFMERRAYFAQKLTQSDSPEYKIFNLYFEIQKRLSSLENKEEAVEIINNEFYKNNIQATRFHYQLLLNYLTPLDHWSIYKKGGFYLLLPDQRLSHWEKVTHPEDTALHYFEMQKPAPLVDVLRSFLNTDEEWDIVLSGHGGSFYHEFNHQGRVTWEAEPVIADLRVNEFKELLAFLNSEVNTHLFHYSGCYSGGNHITLAFDQTYNFPIICDTLTDCYSYCKWNNQLPSDQKENITSEDLHFAGHWQLAAESPYRWSKFFSEIKEIDFSPDSVKRLPEILSSITHSIAADISILRLANADSFIPLHPVGDKIVLLDSAEIGSIELTSPARFLSIVPGNATHHIKKLQCATNLDLPSAFWQSEGLNCNKTFLVDECIFPNGFILHNVLIIQQKNYLIRIFFTQNNEAKMIVANKLDSEELKEQSHVLEIVTLSDEAKRAYQEYLIKVFRPLEHSLR